MNNDQPLHDALPSLVIRASRFLEVLGLKHKVNANNDKHTDPNIEFDGTGIGVSIFWGEQPTITGTKPRVEYGVFTTSYDPGVRYYPDGSGEPPSWDVEEYGESSFNQDDVLIQAIQVLVKNELELFTEAEADEAFANEG